MILYNIIRLLKKLPGIVYGLTIIIVFFSVTANYFFTFVNMMNILKHASVLIMVSLGMTLAILLGKIDMSVGSVMSLVGVVTVLSPQRNTYAYSHLYWFSGRLHNWFC